MTAGISHPTREVDGRWAEPVADRAFTGALPMTWGAKLAWLFAHVPGSDGTIHTHAALAAYVASHGGHYGPSAISRALKGERSYPRRTTLTLIARFFLGDEAEAHRGFLDATDPAGVAAAMARINFLPVVLAAQRCDGPYARPSATERQDNIRYATRLAAMAPHQRAQVHQLIDYLAVDPQRRVPPWP